MLSLFTPQGQIFLKTTLLGNGGVRQMLGPKLALLILLAGLGGPNGWGWLALASWAGLELGLTFWVARQGSKKGISQARIRRTGGLHLGLAAFFGLLCGATFYWWPVWAAVSVGLVALLGLLMIYLVLGFRLLLADMRGNSNQQLSSLFEQVRQMQDLDSTVAQLEMHLMATKNQEERANIVLYLAWANTYRGHLLLPAQLWKQAADYYKKALKLDPTNPAARAGLVISYLHQTEFELALGELTRGIAVFNGQSNKVHYNEALWHWQRNEITSEYEQSAGLFQLCALAIGLLEISSTDDTARALLKKEFIEQALLIPDHTEEQLTRLMSRKGGQMLGALQVLLGGSFRAPANPLELVKEALMLPLLPIQTIEDAENAA